MEQSHAGDELKIQTVVWEPGEGIKGGKEDSGTGRE